MAFDQHTELQLMEALENDPETTQADMAASVGVAVGTVNWYLKRWSAKGYVKIKRLGRWRWRYLLTPQGMAEKATLAGKYVEASMRIYRQTRSQAKELLGEVRDAGYEEVVIDGDGDIAEICHLTCLEIGVKVAEQPNDRLPELRTKGLVLKLVWPEEKVAEEVGLE